MGKWLNGAREVRTALAAAGAVQIAGQVPVATAGLFAPALPAWSRDRNAAINILNEGLRLLA